MITEDEGTKLKIEEIELSLVLFFQIRVLVEVNKANEQTACGGEMQIENETLRRVEQCRSYLSLHRLQSRHCSRCEDDEKKRSLHFG